MNGHSDRIYPATVHDFPWEQDSLGLPYGLWWGLEFDWSGAVDLGEHTPPGALTRNQSMGRRVMQMEGKIAPEHLDSPISRHGQQAHALAHMRMTRGFAPVCTMLYHWIDGSRKGTSRLYLQTGTEFWTEVGA